MPYHSTYGLTPELHRMKVGPWTARLRAATGYLRQATRRGDLRGVLFGIEDASFWVGRIMCEGIGAAEGAAVGRKLYKVAARTVQDATAAIHGGKALLEAHLDEGGTPGAVL